MPAKEAIHVEVCCATPELQALAALTLPAGTTAGQALERSGLLRRFPGIDTATLALGVAGKTVGSERVLADGERLEVLRPLTADPKEARRRRAASGKTRGKGGK
jgi:putative ubiquitin-RnfH superfamily antitoxin RatB of RatAB toxin-antitoxin module